MKQFSESKKIVKGLTFDEFRKLIGVIPSKDKISKTAFLLGYGAGLRIGEIVALQKDDLKHDSISIWDSKGGKDRVVPKPKGWRDYMNAQIPIKLSARSLERRFKKYAKKAKLPEHYVFHSLRHGFGTRAIEQGVPINQLQLLMGHSNVSITNVYIKARPKDALKSYQELF